MPQYVLPLRLPAIYAEANFVTSACNEEACRRIASWPAWSQLLLSGPAGCGKTHLGHIWAARAQAHIIEAPDMVSAEAVISHTLLEHIESADEEILLHAINIARENGFSLLLTARLPAAQLPFTLPDLTSRLRAMPSAAIEAPDDEALSGALRKQFADRQIKAPEEAIAYLLARAERSFAAIGAIVERLDAHMLMHHRSLTIPLIREALA